MMADAGGASGAGNGSAIATMLRAVVRTRVGGNLLMLLALGGGLLVASNVDVTMAPKIDPKVVYVTVPYPGSSASEVEETITRRIEERLVSLNGVRRVTSRASAGLGQVRVDIEALADTDDVREKVRAAVDRIERFPPPDADRPEVAVPEQLGEAFTMVVSSSDLSTPALREAAERVREDLLALPEVTTVLLKWTREREIAVEVSEDALKKHGLTMAGVADTLQRASVDLTSGRLLTPGGGFVVRITDRGTEVEDFENMVLIAQPDGGTITLSDVARVQERFGDPTSLTELDGVPAIFVTTMASADGLPVVEVAEAVRRMLVGYEPPPGVELTVWEDTSWRAHMQMNVVLSIGVLGLALVFVFLALVFDFRLALWVAVGLPTSFFGAIILFPAFDLTLNFVVLFGLVIMIGIVVDDAIVIGESIARERERGLEGADAAIAGAQRVFWPVVVGVTTTFVAFAPLLFTHGALGQFVTPVATVVGLVLAMSLIEAFFILPSHLATAGDWSRGHLARVQSRMRAWIDEIRDRWAVSAIAFATLHPYAMLASAVSVIVLAGALIATGAVRFTEFAQAPLGTVEATLTYPIGTPLAVTATGAQQVADAARRARDQFPDAPARGIAMVVGHNGRTGVSGDGTHLAFVAMRLGGEGERVGTEDVRQTWRREIGEVVGAERVEVSFPSQRVFGSTYGGLSLALVHPDKDVLREATGEFIARLEGMPGVLDVSQSGAPGRRHFDLELTPAGRAAGLTASSLATQLRARFFGAEVQRIQRGRDEVKVMVRYPEDQRRSFAELLDERVSLAEGGEMPLAIAARVIEHAESQTLARINGVSAEEVDVLLAGPTRTQVAALLVNEVVPALEARYDRLEVKPMGTMDLESQVFTSLAYTLPLALLIMYILMAVQFRSYGQPLVILTGVPVAAAGAVFAHLLLGYELNLISVFGIVAVLGVGINDTLLLIDRYNDLQSKGSMPAIGAISGAVRERFRPVLITTVTTIVGLLPALYLTSELTLSTVVPMVVSIIGGLTFGSAAILFVVPAILLIAEGVQERWTGMTTGAVARS